ncbi:MAG: hypothetical protein AB1467_02555 [Candidatus Diapherotrites archaeon]
MKEELNEFKYKLNKAKGLPEVFDLVKESVEKFLGKSRTGLMLGLSEMPADRFQLLGGFFVSGTNLIVLNKAPLNKIKESKPELFNPYCYHLLLHEYLHSLGFEGEEIVRRLCYEISSKSFGEGHLATQLSKDWSKFFPNLIYTHNIRANAGEIELVEGFDANSINYVT